MFPFLYETERDREDWGEFFCGPGQLEHSKETLIARFPRTSGDGHDVEVYVCALPARFYSVRVLPRQPEQYHEECNHASARLGTGSGFEMAELARRLAQEIAAGMVNMEVVA